MHLLENTSKPGATVAPAGRNIMADNARTNATEWKLFAMKNKDDQLRGSGRCRVGGRNCRKGGRW